MRRVVLVIALSVVAISSSLTVAPPAHAAFPGQNGLIAYVTTSGDHKVIETVDAQGGDRQPLIDLGSGRDAIDPAWSHDGLKIAFAGQESPGGPFVIYTANANGTGTPQQVTRDPGWWPGAWLSDTDPTWSPDGTTLAFVRTFTDHTSVIWSIELGTESTPFIYAHEGVDVAEPAWSPDGTRVAFSARGSTCGELPCRWQVLIFDVYRGSLVNFLRDPFPGLHDWHHPDWSPDGTMIVASFGDDEAPLHVSGILVFDVASGYSFDDPLTPCHIMTDPSFSPDGRWVLVTSTPIADPATGELGEPNLCVIRTDSSEAYLLNGSSPRSAAAWRAIPGSEPPPPPPGPDMSHPTIEFQPDPATSKWLDPALGGSISIIATDDRSTPYVECFDGAVSLTLNTESTRLTATARATLPEGLHYLHCTAMDQAGNRTSASATYGVDLTPPVVDSLQVTPTVARVGQEVVVSAVVTDEGLDLETVNFLVAGTSSDTSDVYASGPMTASGSTYTARFVPRTADLSRVTVSAPDRVGFVAESSVPFVSYDPSAGSTDGTGWIVPGGPTSDLNDDLPGLDGTTKASFAFAAKYRTPASVTPSGTLTFSYGSRLKLQSRELSWLAVQDGRRAYLGGLATIQGMNGEFPFVAEILDGAIHGRPDRFELRVYEPGTEISSPSPLFSASGDASGQVHIRT